MIKTKIGNYLRNLRKENNWSLDELSTKIAEMGGEASINSISDWEKGVNYPSIDNLELLSQIYGKTIDEILDGEDYIDVDYSKEYILANEHWGLAFSNKANLLWQIRNENILKIVNRFKELLLIRLDREFSHSEENEFKFLFNNFYKISDYAEEEYVNNDANDNYLRIKSAIISCIVSTRNMSIEEKYWELEKLFDEKDIIMFKYLYDIEELNESKNQIILKRFDALEDWYKDMLLATFQNVDPISSDPNDHGSMYLQIFEDNNGEKYDREKYIKNKIKIMIKHGAKINRYFLNFKRMHIKKYRVIDKLEELYNLCEKPIKVSCYDEDEESNENIAMYYLIENNSKNRFLYDYYFKLTRDFGSNYFETGNYDDAEKLYEFFMKYETIPDDIKLDIAKKYCEKHKCKIDYSKEERFWMADLNRLTKNIFEIYDECRQKENIIENSKAELKNLEGLLYSGKTEYEVVEFDEIGGKDQFDKRNNIIYWKENLTYDQFLEHRDDKLTKELLKEIDNLSIQEIRDKYFKVEVEND